MAGASRKASSQKATRPQPYNRERPRSRQPPQPLPQQQPASPSTSMRPSVQRSSSCGPRSKLLSTSSSVSSSDLDVQNTRRAYLLECIRERYPDYQPLNDFEIFVLGISNDDIPQGELRTWLDEKFAQQLAWRGDAERVFEDARIFLDLSGGITGAKPRPGTRNVYVRPIPDSDYSLRLFPGNLALQEYCADFVRTNGGQSVDCPPGFELWSLPSGAAPFPGPRRLSSLERTFSCLVRRTSGTTQGETFVLKDGQDCLLKRPGHPNVRFTVPMRTVTPQNSGPDEHVLDFPTHAL